MGDYVNDTRALTRVLQEMTGGVTRSYVPGVSQFDSSTSAWNFFHGDAQNSRALTNASATVSKRWEYDPFGQIRAESGTASEDNGGHSG